MTTVVFELSAAGGGGGNVYFGRDPRLRLPTMVLPPCANVVDLTLDVVGMSIALMLFCCSTSNSRTVPS